MPFNTAQTTTSGRDESRSPTISWLSRSSSSDTALPSPHGAAALPRLPSSAKQTWPPVTYVPPLIDGACGTLSAEQRPVLALLTEDLKEIWAVVLQVAAGLRQNWHGNCDLLIRVRDLVLQFSLSVVELAILACVVPLWMMLPGVVFLAWLCLSMSLVFGVSSFLNGTEVVVNYDGSGGWTMEPEIEEERWVFVGSIITRFVFLSSYVPRIRITRCPISLPFIISIDRLKRESLPLLSRLFMRPITGIYTPTSGLLLDLLLLALHRTFPPLPSQSKRALYSELRGSLLDSSIRRVVVLAHGAGAVLVAPTLSRLCADIPAEKLAKLEIYTFGAASREFVVPLGERKEKKTTSTVVSRRDGTAPEDRRGPHIEHFAFVSDPLAQLGILRTIYRNFDVRFCGDIFVLRNHPRSSLSPRARHHHHLIRPTGQLSDYLCALFPTSLLGCCDTGRPSVLDYVMGVDRDTAEKRELAALEAYAETKRSRDIGHRKTRRSWTGLGATVGVGIPKNGNDGVIEGVAGLQMARKGCRDYEGHRGRDVSRLAAHVRCGDMMRASEHLLDVALGAGKLS